MDIGWNWAELRTSWYPGLRLYGSRALCGSSSSKRGGRLRTGWSGAALSQSQSHSRWPCPGNSACPHSSSQEGQLIDAGSAGYTVDKQRSIDPDFQPIASKVAWILYLVSSDSLPLVLWPTFMETFFPVAWHFAFLITYGHCVGIYLVPLWHWPSKLLSLPSDIAVEHGMLCYTAYVVDLF